ncbi:sirohydrochlorin chelatase [Variovorax sp. HJSM1_2]|uniref:sirohydrochlorin chelatase n=1 Tax=Variovorax sp. HJSM1_2 TaxID=3366263 RepID=UPI003BD1FF71
MPRKGILLFAHGSRDPLWHQPMQAVAARVAALEPNAAVCCAYLELTEPDFATAAAQLLAQGVSNITVVPLFLGVGRHAREDLPQLLQAAQTRHPSVVWKLQPAVGEHPELIDLIAKIALG